MQQATQAVQQLQAENQQLKQEQQVKLAEVQSDAQVALQEASIKAKTTVDAKLIDVAGELLAEHMGLRAQAVAAGASAPAPVGLGEIVQGLQGTVAQVQESAETGAPIPVPAMRVQQNPSADAVVILEGVNQIVGRMVEALTAPRAMQVQTDAAGNVIGGMSVPVTMQ